MNSMTRKLLKLFCIGIFMGLCSCASDEDKVMQTVKEYANAAVANNSDKQREPYPEADWGAPIKDNLSLEGATVKKDGDNFIVDLPHGRCFYVSKKSDKFIITDSRNILDANDNIAGGSYHDLAVATGMINGRGSDTDVTWLKNVRTLIDDKFLGYLKHKYPEAANGNMKTIDVRHKAVTSLYPVYITYESGGNSGVNITATIYNKEGKRVSSQTKYVGATAKGDRDEVMILFKTAAVGNVGKVDVSYQLPGYDNDAELLLAFAPLSKSDYKDYLESNK